MTNSYFRNESESVLRYRYCAFKARHSTGSAKANWEYKANLAREDAISEKLQKEVTAKNRNHLAAIGTPVGITDKMSFYRINDNSVPNLRVLSEKTLPEINALIKYWENHLEQVELSNLAKSVLRYQLRKLRTVKAIMSSHSTKK